MTADEATLDERRQRSLDRVQRLSGWLDEAVRVPVIGVRVGLDPVLGLVPGVGDAGGLVLSSAAVAEAVRVRAPRRVLARMLGNIVVDFGVGLIPIAGDIFDVYWKANIRNLKVLEAWLAGETAPNAERRRLAAPVIGAVLVAALLLGVGVWRALTDFV